MILICSEKVRLGITKKMTNPAILAEKPEGFYCWVGTFTALTVYHF
jgi:hypothetical protein